MTNFTNAVLLIVNTNSFHIPLRTNSLITTLVPNLVFYSANTKDIAVTTQSANLLFTKNQIGRYLLINNFTYKATELMSNTASMNLRFIVTTSAYSPNANPVKYYTIDDTTFKYNQKITTLIPNLAFYSANTRDIVTTKPYSAVNNNPVGYYKIDDTTFKYNQTLVTLIPNLAFYSANTRDIVVSTLLINNTAILKLLNSNTTYSNTNHSYSTRGTVVSVTYNSTAPKQFWT